MSRQGLWAALVVLGVTGACVFPSLHPLYTGKDLVWEPKLVGVWVPLEKEEDEPTYEFRTAPVEEGEPKRYELKSRAEGKEGRFEARLVRLKGALFLDLFPAEGGVKGDDLYKMHLVPAHTFVRILQVEPTLRYQVLDPEWMEKLLKADPKAIRHEKVEELYVLTASTAELRAFYGGLLERPEAWTEPVDLIRKEER
jgi:hypothetical protein